MKGLYMLLFCAANVSCYNRYPEQVLEPVEPVAVAKCAQQQPIVIKVSDEPQKFDNWDCKCTLKKTR